MDISQLEMAIAYNND